MPVSQWVADDVEINEEESILRSCIQFYITLESFFTHPLRLYHFQLSCLVMKNIVKIYGLSRCPRCIPAHFCLTLTQPTSNPPYTTLYLKMNRFEILDIFIYLNGLSRGHTLLLLRGMSID